ncbi:MAG: heavy-metal-associated domain-containing protein [Actinomycetota bacterium]|jgi:copper chaperone|nr:heavy-metal-associated domain-containing protein [Actinomycetota bacterium]MDA8357107.1 heavy-metal-associated domain-containing protein [Actinomycetota bacterium]
MGQTTTFKVPAMTCNHCKLAVATALSAVQGVGEVEVDLDTKLVTVAGTNLDHRQLRAAIEQAGYAAA